MRRIGTREHAGRQIADRRKGDQSIRTINIKPSNKRTSNFWAKLLFLGLGILRYVLVNPVPGKIAHSWHTDNTNEKRLQFNATARSQSTYGGTFNRLRQRKRLQKGRRKSSKGSTAKKKVIRTFRKRNQQ